MSMICRLIDVEEAQINELLANPDNIHNFVEGWFENAARLNLTSNTFRTIIVDDRIPNLFR